MKKKNVTISDIAAEAGVSKATVSRVISDSPKVKAELKARIQQIMKDHSYIPNHLAQSLAGSPRKTVGIVIDELTNFFFIEVADGFDQIISQADYCMQISSSKWNAEKEVKLVQHLISNRVDGIVLAPVSEESESLEMLKSSGIPFILINVIPTQKEIAYVSCDNYQGGKLAADFFNKLNRPSNILITGFSHQSLSLRINGFKDNFNRCDKLIHYENISTYEQGYEMASVLVVRNGLSDTKTALFVTNDNVAIGIITRLLELGISIPEQVSVIGYDDIKISSFCRVPLTTVSQGIKDIGKIAAMELLEMIQAPERPKPKHKIEPQLIVRQSAILD
ncbi:MAG: LacI family transcriptional regulator [Spirochaetaceae bacterium 4572_59]|nr:MAG: LacI family transcriptional regulator [Spirochaetaceae bacterium 4572_59]